MKFVQFLGNSVKSLREFPKDVRHGAGRQIGQVQQGKQPDDFKPMLSMCCTPFRRRLLPRPNVT
jgi:phage-related protein